LEDKDGEIHVIGVDADIQAKVRRGEIVLILPEAGRYAIDAKSKLGGIVSDFPGKSRRNRLIFGHGFAAGASSAAHKLYLRAGFGDILVLKDEKPAAPRPRNAAATPAR